MNKFLTTIALLSLLTCGSHAAAQEMSAVVSAQNTAILSSQRGGRITTMPVSLGQIVKTGDLLVQFDCAAELADLAAAEAELQIAAIDAQSQKALVARGAGGRAIMEQAAAREQLEAARRDRVKVQVATCDVRAPFDGAISDVSARAFENVQSGAPLMELVDVDNLQLEVIVPSDLITQLVPGTGMVFQDAATQSTHDLEIIKVAPKIDGVSQTIRIIAQFSGTPMGLVPGSAGIVRFK